MAAYSLLLLILITLTTTFFKVETNAKRKTIQYFPVVAHNLSHFDLHLICKALMKNNFQKKKNNLCVLPTAEENYISVTISAYIKTDKNKN